MSFKISSYLRAIVITAGIISLMVGILVIIGWIFDISILKSLNPNFISMKANTAICFIFFGISIIILRDSQNSFFLKTSARILTIIVLLISAINLFEYILNWNAGIDEFLFKDIPETTPTIYPGRMAGNTVICFILLCIALLITDTKFEWGGTVTQLIALTTALISVLPQFGYAYKEADLFTFVFHTPMALHTAITFLTISIGVFFLRPASGILKVLSSDGTGGFLARRLFPVIIIIPILFIWSRLAIQAGGYNFKTLDLELISLFYIVIYVVTLWKVVGSLNSLDAKQKLAQADLRQSEKKYRKIFENVQDVNYQVDINELIMEISPSIFRMTGYRREELIGKPVTQFYYDLNERAALIEQVSKKGEVWDFEARLRTKSGQIKYTSFNAHLLFDAKGQNIGIEGSIRDIDERKQFEIQLQKAKEKAEESDRLKSAFLQNISHEIRTPMNAIMGFTSLIGNPDTSSEMQVSFVKAVQKSSKQLLSIINDIVDVSSIEANLIEKNVTVFNLNSTLNNLYTQFTIGISENNISFNLKSGLPDDRAMIQTDQARLVQVLSNLLNNAIKFTKKGHIGFGYVTKDSMIEFFVSDTGIGIHPDFHSKVFNSFYQVENSLSRSFGGPGLGLFICKAYVELLGGKIWLESEQGKGSVFYFNIPFDQVL